MKTVSNPAGIGAPVKMRTAPPTEAVPALVPAASLAVTGSTVSPSGTRLAKQTA
jgi:hypothetical protein